MTLNRTATVAKDPFKKCAYFLSLLEGDKTQGWVAGQNDWLEYVEQDPDELPRRMNAWQVMQEEFKKAFINYASKEQSYDQLSKLRMKGSEVDEYIATFAKLAREAGVFIKDTKMLRMFSKGLPTQLCDAILQHDDPDTFEQWTKAAQNRQRVYMKKKAIHANYGTAPTSTSGQGQGQQRGWYWKKNESSSNNWRGGQGQGRQTNAPRSRLPPRNDDAMDTSATIRKALSEKDKEEYHAQGHCYECGKQGHLAHDCPVRKSRQGQARARTTRIEENEEKSDLVEFEETASDTPESWTLAACVARLTEDERHAFINEMKDMGEDMGFGNA